MAITLTNNKLYVLGTSEFGPVNTPMKVSSATEVFNIFGERGTLIESYNAISMLSLDIDVYLVKVSGIHSDAYLNINQIGKEILRDAFYVKAKNANEKYNNIKINLYDDKIQFSFESEIEEDEFLISYNFKDYSTIQALVEKINDDTRNLKNEVFCYASCDSSISTEEAFVGVNRDEIYLAGGNSGLFYSKNMLFSCLEKTYSVLEGHAIDIILPLGVNFDDTFTENEECLDKYYDLDRDYLTLKNEDGKYESFYIQLLNFCRSQMTYNFITHGVMSLEKTDSVKVDEEEYLETLEFFKYINTNYPGIDKYRCLISVCAGDLYGIYGTRVFNSSIVYSAIAAALGGDQNTTNKRTNESFTMYNTFESDTLKKLTDLGFVSFRFSPLTSKVTVTNGVTTSDDENFKYFCNIRMVQILCRHFRDILEEFIGEDIFSIIENKKVEAKLEAACSNLRDSKIVDGFDISCVPNVKSGSLFINLDLKTKYMIEKISLNSSIGGFYE